jgi:hypothetical protein
VATDFLFSKIYRPAFGPTQPPTQRVWGTFSGVKPPGREVDHSPPSSAEVKKEWSYISPPPYAFMTWTRTTILITFTYSIFSRTTAVKHWKWNLYLLRVRVRYFPHVATAPNGSGPPHCRGFTIIQTHHTGRTPLDEWSARSRDLYLTTHNTHKKQTSMPAAGFEIAIPASERPQTHTLDSATTGIGKSKRQEIKVTISV